MTPDRITDTYLAAAVRSAIASRLADRRWYRRMAAGEPERYAARWSDLSHENDVRLRELVRVARAARAIARPAIEREAAMAAALVAGDFYAYPVAS